MKPVCIPCRRFFRPHKNGFFFTEGMPKRTERPAPPGPDAWEPYKLWCGDVWKCQGCGAEIIVGVGLHPVHEHYMPGFEATARALNPTDYQVNDC